MDVLQQEEGNSDEECEHLGWESAKTEIGWNLEDATTLSQKSPTWIDDSGGDEDVDTDSQEEDPKLWDADARLAALQERGGTFMTQSPVGGADDLGVSTAPLCHSIKKASQMSPLLDMYAEDLGWLEALSDEEVGDSEDATNSGKSLQSTEERPPHPGHTLTDHLESAEKLRASPLIEQDPQGS